MSESPTPEPTHPGTESKPESEELVQQIRTQGPQAPFGEDEPDPNAASDATAAEMGGGADTEPGISGYGERDPATEMPRMTSAPESQEDPKGHDAAPEPGTDTDPHGT